MDLSLGMAAHECQRIGRARRPVLDDLDPTKVRVSDVFQHLFQSLRLRCAYSGEEITFTITRTLQTIGSTP